MIALGTVENAFVATLKRELAKDLSGYSVKTIDSYGGEFDDVDVAKVLNQLPAILVNFAGYDAPVYVGADAEVTLHYLILACAPSLRNEKDGRQGSGADRPGAFQLLDDAAFVLDGSDLGLNDLNPPIKVQRPVAIGACRQIRNGLVQKSRLAVYALETTITVVGRRRKGGEPLGDFRTFHVDWDIPPFAGPAAILPADPPRDGESTTDLSTN